MANDTRLIATLEARVRDFEKNLAKANATADRQFGGIERRASRAGANLERTAAGMAQKVNAQLGRISSGLGTIGASFAGGVIGGGIAQTIGSIVPAVRGATKALSDLYAEAKMAGVDVETFQALGYAARQSNVGMEALTDGLKELQLRADEFIVTGKGPAAETFDRLGYGADELKAKLRDPSELFLEIIGRLQALDKAAQIRIADEVFGGTGGEQFVRFLEEGEAGIRRNMQAARDLGVVLDRDVIRKGVELDKQFQKIADTIDHNVKNAVVNVATAIRDWTTNTEKFLNALGNSEFFKKLADVTAFDWSTVGGVTPLAQRPQSGLDPRAADVLRRALEAAGNASRANVPDRAQQLPGTFVDPKLAGLKTDFQAALAKMILAARDAGHDIKIQSGFRSVERQQQLWAQAIAKYGSEAEARKWVAPPGSSFHNKGTAADLNYSGGGMQGNTAAAQAARLWAQQNAARFGLTFPLGNEPWHVEPAGQRGQPKDGDPDTSGLEKQASDKAAAARKKEADQAAADAKRRADAIATVVESLTREGEALGEINQQEKLRQALKDAGVEADSAAGMDIARRVEDLYRLKAAAEAAEVSEKRLKEAREEMAEAGADATKTFISQLRSGASAADAFKAALDRIIDRLLDSAIDGLFKSLFNVGGGSGGLLGSLGMLIGGGGRAEGGAVGPVGYTTAEKFL